MKRWIVSCGLTTILFLFAWVSPAAAQDEDDGDEVDFYGGEADDSAVDEEEGFGDVFGDDEDEYPQFQFNGYIMNQTGVFISDDKSRVDDDGLPIDHGNKLGRLSMMRNTLQLEVDYAPLPSISIHTIFRGVRSLKLDVDKDAQVPIHGYYGNNPRTIDWVRDNYYTETAIREIYLDAEPTDWLHLRIGKQQISWGETGQYRLLDVINPVNATWHFGPLESFEDTRVPLWMVKALFDIPAMRGSLEVVWMPMLDDPKDTVTVPLTFVGAWGLPPVPSPSIAKGDDSIAPWKIRDKIFLYPERQIRNSRGGFRWQGEIGDFMTYTLVYYYTHQLSPPIPMYTRAEYGAGDEGVDVYIGFPRQHIVGFSLETTIPYPLGTNIKLEAAFEPDRTFPVFSLMEQDLVVQPNGDRLKFFRNKKKKVLSYALTIQQPALIRWLNPEQSIWFIFQFMHTAIFDFDPAEKMIDVPGYDTTFSKEHSFKLIGAIFTNYVHGLISPRIIGAWLFTQSPGQGFGNSGGFVSGQVLFRLGTDWRIKLAVSGFFGSNPYSGVGLFRDRDEVNLSVKYQF
ncbi:MAG: hypothetical protein GXP54_09125 [Deltaproteobacteria bacterium]|nr:hypothetical protein [Deltaproteobacteria bacterium]